MEMLSSKKYVKLPYPKIVVEKVVIYLYSGKMDADDLALRSLLDLMELLNMINLPSKSSVVEVYTLKNITNGKYAMPDCLKSLDDCSKMGLHSVGQTLLTYRGPQPARPAESSNKRYKRWAMRILMDYDFMSILRQLNVINNIFSSGLNFSLFYYQ